jgi:hypothetical protein
LQSLERALKIFSRFFPHFKPFVVIPPEKKGLVREILQSRLGDKPQFFVSHFIGPTDWFLMSDDALLFLSDECATPERPDGDLEKRKTA